MMTAPPKGDPAFRLDVVPVRDNVEVAALGVGTWMERAGIQ